MPAIYLDNHATTQVDPRVATKVVQCMTEVFGNASSSEHIFGDDAEAAVKRAKEQISGLVGCSPREIVFTSGATESINLAIKGSVSRLLEVQNEVGLLVSPVEHKAVIDVCENIAKTDSRVTLDYLSVDSLGRFDIVNIKQRLEEGKVDLLAVMAANNEIGNIYPISDIAKLCAERSVLFVCDATQAVGKIPITFTESGIDMLALSAHKIYGPKGIGALVCRRDLHLVAQIHGGAHQNSLRAGTLNVPGIVGRGWACYYRQIEMERDEKNTYLKRNLLSRLLEESIEGFRETGDLENKLASNLHFSVPGIPNSAVISRIRDRVAISTGSACTTGIEEPSHVLQAMELSSEYMEGSFRVGVGKFNTDSEIQEAAELIISAVREVRRFFPVEHSNASVS